MLCETVNDDQVFVGDNSEKSSGLGDENDVNLVVNEEISSNESDDEKYYYYMNYYYGSYYDHCYYNDIDMLSDSESVTSVNPDVDLPELRGDDLPVLGVVEQPILGVGCLVLFDQICVMKWIMIVFTRRLTKLTITISSAKRLLMD